MALQRVDQPSADTPLFDHARGGVRMSDFWKQRTTVFIFLRHFG